MRMYAIAFDLEQDTLSKTYGGTTYTNAYNDIKKGARAVWLYTSAGLCIFWRCRKSGCRKVCACRAGLG